ncbi:uncharacterized protein NEMAJ01_1474 [Nematocida major]|uniref:uncharacterized protein n=1 Tax=Nematocida major TaxID=1912982 RepID=UPI002008A37F|nr:uncharacterized protein NEMAJ01_1474 [Nematocida major]KAH9386578.1 hypothetical protein NEMAJ01_1474 [Nematocida major]
MRICFLALCPLAWCRVAMKVIEAIQESRKKSSMPLLKVTSTMNEIARDRAESLAEASELVNKTEYLWDLARKHGYKPVAMGENIGKSINKEMDGMDIFREWIKSETHRENIVAAPEYTHMGVYYLKAENNIYISAVFGQVKEDAVKEKKSQEKPKEEDTSGLAIKSSRFASEPPKDPQPPGKAPSAPALGNPSEKSAPAMGQKAVLTQVGKSASSFELVYPNGMDLKDAIMAKMPVQLVLQASEEVKAKAQVPPAGKEAPSGTPAQAPSNPSRSPAQNTLLKLIMVQPVRNSKTP